MDFLRLVIIEKCEVKDIEIDQIMTGYHGRHFGELFRKWAVQHFCFSTTSNFEHKKVASVVLVYSTR